MTATATHGKVVVQTAMSVDGTALRLGVIR
jgi:hypothetical protein